MHWSEVWEARAPAARLVRAALTPASWLYAAGWTGYLAAYRLGLKRPAEPHRPVVCVGNLVVGGSGKSPFALYLADLLRSMGRPVALSCSGYGSPAAEGARIAPPGPLDPAEWGDEPAMHRWIAPELPLIVGRRRVLAAELCREQMPDHMLLMDDGFQHLPIRKHLSIVLDPDRTNRSCLPAGPYREPRGFLSRADLVLPSSEFRLRSRSSFQRPTGEEVVPSGSVRALCALGEPTRFLRSLEAAGWEVDRAVLKPDHDPLQEGNLLRDFPEGTPIVVTAKDWVKLRMRPDVEGRNVVVAMHHVSVEPEGEFRRWLEHRLHEIEEH
jgi:tetraacyldisaccharide 4'-kinase